MLTPDNMAHRSQACPRLQSAASYWGLFWLAVAIGAAGVFFIDGLDALVEAWSLPEYSHGPLIPILSGLLFLRQLKEYPPEPGPKRDRWVGVLIILAAFAMGTLGKLANISDVVAYATILWVGGLLLVSFGWKTGRHFWPPVLHLVYMLPLPGLLYFKLSNWLQLISSELGVFFLQLANVPVYLEGNIIDLGVLRLQVAEACSGLRYLFPILSFSYIFAVIYRGPMWHKAVLLISAAPITVFMNSVRIAVAGIIAQRYGTEWLERVHPLLRGLGNLRFLRGDLVRAGMGAFKAAKSQDKAGAGTGPGNRRPRDSGSSYPAGAALCGNGRGHWDRASHASGIADPAGTLRRADCTRQLSVLPTQSRRVGAGRWTTATGR
jgi:exosortase